MEMETIKSIEQLLIPTNIIFYDKKTEILSIHLEIFTFIGNYKKSTRLNKILDDVYKALGETLVRREYIAIVDFVTQNPFSESTKLKKLNLISNREKEKKQVEIEEKESEIRDKKEIVTERKEKAKAGKKRKLSAFEDIIEEEPSQIEMEGEEEILAKDLDRDNSHIEEKKKESIDDEIYESVEHLRSAPKPPPKAMPSSAPSGPPSETRAEDAYAGFGQPPPKKTLEPITKPETSVMEEPKPTVYEINMGLQYYSVMMEQTSYLFYIYFSHKELKIIDEEGKTVFETSFVIKTTKKEPPVVDLRVEGEGFEVHPLNGKVVIKKDAINPPVMIFSVLPTKKKNRTKKDKKEGERRYLNVYIDFEGNTINHSVLSIIVQPKHFHLDIGLIHLDISKRAAVLVSVISILIAAISLIYTFFSIDPSSTFIDVISNFSPGLGAVLFIGIFLYTLFKEGIYPLKEKISYFLNFDKSGMIIK
jgi:hypothetical protein